jgi:DNA modification methylase
MAMGVAVTVKILTGDCRDVLKTLPDESAHCVVTSPPYFGLRDYGQADQMGLEATPEAYIEGMVSVFREVRRVLRADGTMWVNMGDSYATDGGPGWQGKNGDRSDRRFTGTRNTVPMREQSRTAYRGHKPKDLLGMPWMLAFALRADGWWLRQDIIWSKPNPMPESVRDRCTKAHEYLFLFAKSERYYFDAEAISEPATHAHEYVYDNGQNGHGGGVSHAGQGSSTRKFKKGIAGWADPQDPDHSAIGHSQEGRTTHGMVVQRSGNKERKPASARVVPVDTGGKSAGAVAGSVPWEGVTRNKRSVWTVTTQPFKDAHFATFPPALIIPCILAGCPPGGLVLDPFAGAGTTGLVADQLQRDAVLIELSPTYSDMARERIRSSAPLFVDVQ